jgi:DNA-binding SARP family transcriptional activator
LEVGTRDDESVSLNLASLGAVNLVGPSANNVVRAWCAAVLTAAGPGGAEILTTVSVVDDLFSDLRPTPAIRSVSSSEALLGGLEAEIVGRSRQLDDADVPDAASYRAARPEDPLPFLLGVVDQAPGISTARWRALCDSAGRLDVAVIVLGNHQLGTTQIATDSTRTVTSASPADLKQQLEGAMLFGLDTHEARELIDAVISAHEEGSAEAECDGSDPEGSLDQAPEEPVQKWPVEPMTQSVGTSKPIRVRLLGPYQISAHGEEVTKGLRSAAKELLAWYLLRPEGASAEAAVDALWPDTSPEFVTKRFWRALGDLRSRLRLEDSSEKDAILIRSGDHYHPQGDKLTCDLWDFQDHLSHAARADKDNEALYALRRAVDVYRGDFVSDADYLWIGPIREDLHRRALDAHLRLAELEEAFGNDDAAVDVLSHAIQVDQYAEEVFRRLMALQGRIGRSDSIAATWRVLERNLANLELDPELASVRVYQELTHSDDSVSAAATSRR